jgi:hypothetical protein
MKSYIMSVISQRRNSGPVDIGGDPDPVNNIKAYVNLMGLSSIWVCVGQHQQCCDSAPNNTVVFEVVTEER